MISTLLLFFAAATGTQHYSYWVQPCVKPVKGGCEAADPELADWALEAWQKASNGRLFFSKEASERKAQIRVYWVTAGQGLYGETKPTFSDGKRGAEVFVAMPGPQSDPLLRDTIVYLTCLHESGHAIGLVHTSDFSDIMYSFQFGGDIPEYFGRYRRKLAVRGDIRHNSGISSSDRKHLLIALGSSNP